jgi:uncharacterized protein YprB with RNaseH-like and TPR domain
MSKLQDKLDYLNKNQHKEKIQERWKNINALEGLSTREKLEKLVKTSLKREEKMAGEKSPMTAAPFNLTEIDSGGFFTREFSYPLSSVYGKFPLSEWKNVSPNHLAIIAGDDAFLEVSPMNVVFFDTETTGLSGGTGTIPFMLGFGYYLEEDFTFRVKMFILNSLDKEAQFLEAVDGFLQARGFSAVVTFNGKTFDFPLMEGRYILQRKRFPLLKLLHLDFLFPARTLWKYTYPSCKLSLLGDCLLGISRDEDIDPSRIPVIYFNYLRARSYGLIQGIVEHNALDLLGLAGLLLVAAKYVEDISHTLDEGEVLGVARLFDRYGDIEKADELYRVIKQSGVRTDIKERAIKGLAIILKKRKVYSEAAELWGMLSTVTGGSFDKLALRELSVHLEHREKNFVKALAAVHQGLEIMDLSDTQRNDFEKRYQRLNRKMKTLQKEDEKS